MAHFSALRHLFCALITGIIFAPPASALDPVDIDYMDCGVIACGEIYQGQGVNHKQVIIHIWPKGSGLNSVDITIVMDFPPNSSWSTSTYIGNTLVEYTGPGTDLTIPAQHAEKIFDVGIFLAEGLEIVFNNPYVSQYGWWPAQSVINELIEDSVDEVPLSALQWDAENGGVPPQGEGNGGQSGNAVGVLVTPDRCIGFECTGIASTGAQSLAIAVTPQQRSAANRARFEEILQPASQRYAAQINRLRAQQSTAAPSNCTLISLVNSTAVSLDACYEKCDECSEEDWGTVNMEITQQCVEYALGGTILAGLLTEGVGFIVGAGLFSTVQQSCMTMALASVASFKGERRSRCRQTCEYLDSISD